MQPDLHQTTCTHQDSDFYGVMSPDSESWLTAPLLKAFSIEVSALNSEVRIFSDGVMVDLSCERYL